MPFSIPQGPELIIILAIVLLIFGASRVKDVMGGLGQGMREFQKGMKGDPKDESGKGKEQGKDEPKQSS